MDVEVFIHPTCATCHRLINLLKEWGYLSRVRVIDTSRDPYVAIRRGVRSVPSIFIDGELVFAGIVDFEELRRILEGGLSKGEPEITTEELVGKFFNGVLDSVATALWLYINEDCEAFLRDRDFILGITNLSLVENRDRLLEELRRELVGSCTDYINELEESFHEVITKNLAREIYWLHGKPLSWVEVSRLYPREILAHWMLVRSALGRVGLRMHGLNEEGFRLKVEKTWRYMEKNFDKAMEAIVKEQERIFSQREYWEILEKLGKNS